MLTFFFPHPTGTRAPNLTLGRCPSRSTRPNDLKASALASFMSEVGVDTADRTCHHPLLWHVLAHARTFPSRLLPTTTMLCPPSMLALRILSPMSTLTSVPPWSSAVPVFSTSRPSRARLALVSARPPSPYFSQFPWRARQDHNGRPNLVDHPPLPYPATCPARVFVVRVGPWMSTRILVVRACTLNVRALCEISGCNFILHTGSALSRSAVRTLARPCAACLECSGVLCVRSQHRHSESKR